MLHVMQNVVIEHNDLLKTCQTPQRLQSMLRNRSTAVLSVHVVDVQMKKQKKNNIKKHLNRACNAHSAVFCSASIIPVSHYGG